MAIKSKTYSDEVKAISKEKNVDLGVAQSMYNSGTRASTTSGNAGTTTTDSGTTQAKTTVGSTTGNAGSNNTKTTDTGNTTKGSSGSGNSGINTSLGSVDVTKSAATETTPTVGNVQTTTTSGNVYKVGADGKAPSGLKAGDQVVTGGGTYTITKANEDGTYDKVLTNANQTTYNYKNGYSTTTTPATTGYNATTQKAFEAREALINGTTTEWTDTKDGSVWTKDANGNIIATKNGQSYIVNFSDAPTDVVTSTVKTTKGDSLSLVKDTSGNIIGLYDNGSYTNKSDYSGEITETDSNGKATYYMVTTANENHAIHKITSDVANITDAEGNDLEAKDADGNILSADDLVFCDNNMTYIRSTGESIGEVSSRYGLDSANARIEVNGKYYSLDGTPVDMPLKGVTWTENDVYNQILDALVDKGLYDVPQWSDYEKNVMSLDEALARAAQQLGGTYETELNDTLDDMNQKALQTGFYGQLPTEALKQQAAAANETTKQNAIYELADQLRSSSETSQKTAYDNDTSRNKALQTTITSMLDYLISINKDALDNATTQDELNNEIQELKEAALERYATLAAGGYTSQQLLDYANSLKTS